MNAPLSWRIALSAAGMAALGSLLTIGRWGPGNNRAHSLTESVNASKVSGDCRGCHAAVWQEWETSFHVESFRHPNVQAAFKHFGHDRKCESCHASEPVLVDFASPIVLRTDDRESGVNCLTCHLLSGGGVAASRTIPTAPCQPIATAELTSSAHCGRCHTAIYEDWQSSRLAGTDKNCQSCHMPVVADRAGGRSHICLGGHDDSTVRGGASFTARAVDDQIVVSVSNATTGHNFPGERHNRVLLLQVIERDAQDQIVRAEQRTIKAVTPFRGESSAEQIRFEQSFEATFPVEPLARTADVRLLYKLFPWIADRDALVVHQSELVLP